MPPSRSLAAGEVHLWWGEPVADAVPDLVRVLSPAEVDAMHRFRFERHRILYAFAHGALRRTLAEYVGADPRALTFTTTSNGRPELTGREVRFNLSHTAGLVLVGVARTEDIGVDAELVEAERGRDEQLAARVFAPRELAAWRNEPDEWRATRFFDRWTLKEAYIKARGDGLSLELRRFGFPSLAENPRIETDFDATDAWQFLSFAPTPFHRAAAAVRDANPVYWRVGRLRL